jgi:acyl-[acyl carrier protein]--UDP-N-acetylglucosamine O-acyltransferase
MSQNVSPLSRVSAGAQIGKNATIGDFTIVHDGVVLGDDAVVESHCVLGTPTPASGELLRIGRGAHIRSHSIFYRGATIGDALVTGHYVVVREKSVIGRSVQLGSNTELQGDLVIGDYTRTQSSVFIPKHCKIGSFVWLLPYVCLTNDPLPPSEPAELGVQVDDYAVLAARTVVLPGVRVGARALVAAQSLVTRDVPPDTVVAGSPARARGLTSEILRRDGSGLPAYPWTRHFHRGYPHEIVAQWLASEGEES